MKTNKRKRLEMEAMILGVTVTYGNITPRNAKKGDRWYNSMMGRYHIAGKPMDDLLSMVLEKGQWYSVGSKRFFDLSDIKN